MKPISWVLTVMGSLGLALGLMVGCEISGGGDGSSGNSAIMGNVVSASSVARNTPVVSDSWLARLSHIVADLMVPSAQAAQPETQSGPGGITVTLSGTEDRTAVTGSDGWFTVDNLPAGEYRIAFTFNGETVRYRGRSGQEATLTVGTNQVLQLLNIRLSGGTCNIGNVRIMTREQKQEQDQDRDKGP